jgi:DNA-binding NarL/FixJ family response regulator
VDVVLSLCEGWIDQQRWRPTMGRPVVGVVVADQRQAFAEGLALILDAQDGLAVVGVAHDTRRAVQLAAEHRPGVLLLDAGLLGGDPVTTPAAVRSASPATKVLLLATDTRHRMVAAAVASGADGLVAKDACGQQVVDAIHAVVMGRRVRVRGSEPPALGPETGVRRLRLETLSGREREVLCLLARAWSTQRIARDMRVAESTVRTHIQNLLEKLDVHCKLEAAAFAWEHGIADADGGAPWTTTAPSDPSPAKMLAGGRIALAPVTAPAPQEGA